MTIDELISRIERIANVHVERTYVPDAPTGVRGRCSDNSRLEEAVGWCPATSLDDGLHRTYEWIAAQLEMARHEERGPARQLGE